MKGTVSKWLHQDAQVSIGRNWRCDQVPRIWVTQQGQVQIGNEVTCRSGVEIRCHNESKLILHDNVKLDRGVRVLACFSGVVEIQSGSEIGFYSIINGAGGVSIGRDVMIAGFVTIQSSAHRTAVGQTIKSQGSDLAPVVIEDDVWLGAGVTVVSGVRIGAGAVVGANSVVTKDVLPGTINVGAPSRKIGVRT